MTKLTIVHERFTEFAGSEAVVEQFAETWPSAQIVAPLGRPGVLPPKLEKRLTTTRLDRLLGSGSYAHLLPALPVAMRHLPIDHCDVVIASHHAFANQVTYATDAPVVSYVHSPARWVWDATMREREVGGKVGRAALAVFAATYKPWDISAAHKVHAFVANSSAVAKRISDWWGRPCSIIHPPVDTTFYTPDPTASRGDFFLLAGRLVAYKRPDIAIQAARQAGIPLVVAGEGRARAAMEALAGPETTFLGRVSNEEMRRLYRTCKALLLPGIEDFGIIPVEAQACGAPVLAIGAGGSIDTVLDNVTGLLIAHSGDTMSDIEVWSRRLREFHMEDYDQLAIRRHAEQFSRARFRHEIRDFVSAL